LKRLKSIFWGTPEFSIPSLEATFNHSDLQLVVTQPDRPRGRGQKLSPCPVKEWAVSKNLKVISPESLWKKNDPENFFYNEIKSVNADIFVVTAYGNILTKRILALPKLAAVNLHASLLPRWRGAAPIQRSLEAGDTLSGVSLQKMIYELDAGNVLAEEELKIEEVDTALSLSEQLSAQSGKVLNEFFEKLISLDEFPAGVEQNPEKITWAEKIEKKEALWQKSWTAEELHNRVRAFRAWPIVQMELNGKKFKILETQLSNELSEEREAGELFVKESQLYVVASCKKLVKILRWQRPGKSPVLAAPDFLNGL